MGFLMFLLKSLAGFVLSMICIRIIFPVAFAGEVFSPLLVPFAGAACILLTSMPLMMVQSRLELSLKTRPLVPFVFGLSWMPLFFGGINILPSLFVFPDVNIWIAIFKTGLLCSVISFVFSLFVAKTADILLLSRVSRPPVQ